MSTIVIVQIIQTLIFTAKRDQNVENENIEIDEISSPQLETRVELVPFENS